MEMARGLGFEAVMPFQGVAAADRQVQVTPLCFFLFAAVPDVGRLRSTADAIRFASSRRVRFLPMMYFSDSPSLETIKRCINMGFDDIVTLPFTRARLEERVQRQIGRTLVYYETASYFGPDRRDREGMPKVGSRPPGAPMGGQFRRLEIARSLISGISVIQDELFEPDAPTYL
jgi:hypothetical protein